MAPATAQIERCLPEEGVVDVRPYGPLLRPSRRSTRRPVRICKWPSPRGIHRRSRLERSMNSVGAGFEERADQRRRREVKAFLPHVLNVAVNHPFHVFRRVRGRDHGATALSPDRRLMAPLRVQLLPHAPPRRESGPRGWSGSPRSGAGRKPDSLSSWEVCGLSDKRRYQDQEDTEVTPRLAQSLVDIPDHVVAADRRRASAGHGRRLPRHKPLPGTSRGSGRRPPVRHRVGKTIRRGRQPPASRRRCGRCGRLPTVE